MIHESVAAQLVTKYGNTRFNAFIDAVGIQSLFNACPGFLSEGKPYVSIGPKAKSYTYWGVLSTLGMMMSNFMWPQTLGGVPRKYLQVTGIANKEAMEELRELMEERSLRVHVGTIVDFKDAQEASNHLVFWQADN
jgi:NADPH:quinone reductase-like Zn-dependent oxidoreductase